MAGLNRKPFQGVKNIIRFNWHFYIFALILIVVLCIINIIFNNTYTDILSLLAIFLIVSGTVVSLAVSYYIYDFSDLYSFNWLNTLNIHPGKKFVNVNAGFDETSQILLSKFPNNSLQVMDFYDPLKHTEVSIERARKVYPQFPGTIIINTNQVPLQANSVDFIFLIFAAHEIRNNSERVIFFKQLANALNTNGKIIVVEHKRDFVNFLAYNFGFFHFLSSNTWHKTFINAGLKIEKEIKLNPFISNYILVKHGTAY